MELFGCYDARLLKDDYGKSKGMAFCEFETEAQANEVYNNSDGWEIGGRWLNLDKLRPRVRNILYVLAVITYKL